MEREIILVFALAGLASLDLTEVWQGMWSQPLVSGPLIGWLLGDWQKGLWIGVLLQLLWLGYVPLGVAVFPDPAIGGVIGSFAFLHFKAGLSFDFNKVTLLVLLFTLIFSYLSGWLTLKNRFWNVGLVHRVEKELESGKNRLNYYFSLALLISFLRGALTGVAGFYLLVFLIDLFRTRLAPLPDRFFDFLVPALFGLGLASLFLFFGKLRNWPYLAGGLLLGAVFFLL